MKTERFYGTARLDDESQGSVVASLADLAVKAAHAGREGWDAAHEGTQIPDPDPTGEYPDGWHEGVPQ